MEQQNSNPKKNNPQGAYKDYIRYSSLAFEMMAIIFVFTFGGYKLDQYFGFKKNILTIVLTIVGLALAIIYLIRKLLKK